MANGFMDEQFDQNDYLPKKVEQQITAAPAAQAMVSRQAQEVQMAMMVAKTYPRDQYSAFNRIMQACERKKLAEEAMYEYPRGGQKVTGPSIRLAEELARDWGNIDFGILELDQRNGESHVMAYAWDLETNTRQTKVFTVKHERKAKGSIVRLDDPRDIYEMVANQGARRVRACILGVIPSDIVDAAVKKCEKTLLEGNTEPLQDRVRRMIQIAQSDYGITKEMLEKYASCNVESFTEHNYLAFTKVFKSIRDGMSKREDYFDLRQASSEISSDTASAYANKKADKGGAKDGDTGTGSKENPPS